MDDSVKEKIRKLALQNAVEHEGKTQDKIILSKALGTIPELRKIVKEVAPIISDIVNSINQIPFEQQKSEIAKEFPDLLAEKPKKEEREGLPPLEGAEQGKVITRFPPSQTDTPTLGTQRLQ
ncbi:hypothetical protein QVH35_05450 [Candidatus Nitrosotenuis chungbukensis]|uniref:hypothetical protein n=1 Tax=Candidatus Nitrosotenuis chungbukensis TaxID=1353246 RepID=UPI00267218F5|nr:hypothetical protein [Candidatus Nitrosotenuis chungbukensis]WKT58771.1 hypothetical protein QVH35_05450 [Candidatus Nitrosotenuis chungbukensis]